MATGEAKEKRPRSTATELPPNGEERRGKISWGMRLNRVLNIDITVSGIGRRIVVRARRTKP